ncbi:MAG: ATP-binding protein [Methanocellales archaeon]
MRQLRDLAGVVFGETKPHEFKFLVSAPDQVRRNDYVKMWHESEGWVLGQVVSITRASDLNSVESAMELVEGKKILSGGEREIAKVVVIGYRDENQLLRIPRTPFSPGTKVFKADNELITRCLGLERGDAYIGLLEGHDLEVKLDINKLVQKHCSIIAKTGGGKSYTVGVIIEELLEKNVPIIIIDPHGEYATLKIENRNIEQRQLMKRFGVEPKSYASQVVVYTPANFKVNPTADKLFRLNSSNLEPQELAELISRDPSRVMGVLYEAILNLKAIKAHYTVEDIIKELSHVHSKAKWSVISALDMLQNSGIFSEKPTSVEELMQRGRASIVDMKGVNPDLQQIIVSRLCRELFEARKSNKIPPGVIIVEEAHRYCPEKGFTKTPSSEILRTIASEGRKFGLGLIVVTQRPARIDKNVLSQCNTQIILKVTNPLDVKAIMKGLEGVSSEVEEEIKQLPPGVALIVSSDIEKPIFVSIRIRRTHHGGASVDITERKKQEEKDREEERKKEREKEKQAKKTAVDDLFTKIFGRRN